MTLHLAPQRGPEVISSNGFVKPVSDLFLEGRKAAGGSKPERVSSIAHRDISPSNSRVPIWPALVQGSIEEHQCSSLAGRDDRHIHTHKVSQSKARCIMDRQLRQRDHLPLP